MHHLFCKLIITSSRTSSLMAEKLKLPIYRIATGYCRVCSFVLGLRSILHFKAEVNLKSGRYCNCISSASALTLLAGAIASKQEYARLL